MMFEVGEIDRFLSGQLGSVLVFQYEGANSCLFFETDGRGHATAYIPIERSGSHPFDVELALAHEFCAVTFRKDDRHIIAEILNRPQFYAVLKIACNHLDWIDDTRITKSFRSQLPVERLAS